MDIIQLKRLPTDTIQPLARSKSLSRLNIAGSEMSKGTWGKSTEVHVRCIVSNRRLKQTSHQCSIKGGEHHVYDKAGSFSSPHGWHVTYAISYSTNICRSTHKNHLFLKTRAICLDITLAQDFWTILHKDWEAHWENLTLFLWAYVLPRAPGSV